MSIHSEATLDRKFIEFAKLMNIYLNHFPAHEKYGLSLQIRTAAYDVYALTLSGIEHGLASVLLEKEVYLILEHH